MQGNSSQDRESISITTANREKTKHQIICFTLKGIRGGAAKTNVHHMTQ